MLFLISFHLLPGLRYPNLVKQLIVDNIILTNQIHLYSILLSLFLFFYPIGMLDKHHLKHWYVESAGWIIYLLKMKKLGKF